MTAKAHIMEVLAGMPDDATYGDIEERVALVAGIRQAQDEAAAGQVVPIEEVEQELPRWISKS